MELTPVNIYQETLGVINRLEEEISRDSSIDDPLQDIKREFFKKNSPKLQRQFARRKLQENLDVDKSLIRFYKSTIKGRKKNMLDQVFEDSAIVVNTVNFFRSYLDVETIIEDHFFQFKEKLRQALIKEAICAFLEKELRSLPIEQPSAAVATSPKQKPGAKREYTIKQQSYAFYLLLGQMLKANSATKTSVAKLLHLFSAKTPPVNSNGNVVMNKSTLYNGYAAAFPSSKTKVQPRGFKVCQRTLRAF